MPTTIDFNVVISKFRSLNDLRPHSSANLGVFALWLAFQEELSSLNNFIVDGRDDGKADVVYFNYDLKKAVVIQATMKQSPGENDTPSINKCDDLNTAATWLLTRDASVVPRRIKPATDELQEGIKNNEITEIEFWYVHNCCESDEVKNHLESVGNTAKSCISTYFNNATVNISTTEVGKKTFVEWYTALQTPVFVSDHITLKVPKGYKISGEKWEAYATAVKVKWLSSMYSAHKEKLFSPNIRGFLGLAKKMDDINEIIKNTCTTEPRNFWIYNNGITCLVNVLNPKDDVDSKGDITLEIEGLAIVNGAQTTGAIASLQANIDENAQVSARFFVCSDNDTLLHIIEYNNTQNKINAADFRSNDSTQKRLIDDFTRVGINYQIRRSVDYLMTSTAQTLKRDFVAQALAAFNRYPYMAYHEKTEIWDNDNKYNLIFNNRTNAKHILFAASLLTVLEKERRAILNLDTAQLTEQQKALSNFVGERGSVLLAATAISNIMEEIAATPIPDLFKIEFIDNLSIDNATNAWVPIVNATKAYFPNLVGALKNGRIIKDPSEQLKNFKQAISSLAQISPELRSTFRDFSMKISTQ